MTEVRPLSSGGQGLFATKGYAVGDVIVEDSKPILCLAPSSDEDAAKLLAALPPVKKGGPKGEQISFLASIAPPSSLSKESAGKFLGMIQVTTCFAELAQQDDGALAKALGLYAPEPEKCSPEEEGIVKVAQEALKYMQNHSKGESKLRKFVKDHPDDALQLMLVWACNAFQGSRVYETQCRINHSCDPNAIIQADGDNQIVRAAAAIKSGDEVFISYLGLLLYADRQTRLSQLISTRHFQCSCARCASSDPAASTPCPTCHARDGRYLQEDVAYDDDQQVNYMYPRQASSSYECVMCHTTLEESDPTLAIVSTVSKKVLAHMQAIDQAAAADDDDADDMEEEWEEQMYQLACSVAGTLHWTTNIVSLMRLNRALKGHHAAMVQTGENPDVEEIAEAIDMLERLCRFVDRLELKLHRGHLLSNAVVGVARTLVSLGDEKSKKYAADWVGKIKDCTDVFESDGMKKVVASLLQAWETRDGEPATKKPKKA